MNIFKIFQQILQIGFSNCISLSLSLSLSPLSFILKLLVFIFFCVTILPSLSPFNCFHILSLTLSLYVFREVVFVFLSVIVHVQVGENAIESLKATGSIKLTRKGIMNEYFGFVFPFN